ncbi:shikimate dehydrogenase [Pelagibius sp. 7325]|uniref:shikimate dehydrogenase family protein n=1 Tax=Pelagibius sp. 7325 TaxID=3131994 RepID=UPI0030EE0D4D
MLKSDERGKGLRPERKSSRAGAPPLKLGLIGDNIAHSKAPLLHSLAGQLAGIAVSYERLVPREIGLGFDDLFARCEADGYRGLNITYPYKEKAARRVRVEDPLVRAMGAINTVIFEPDGAHGFNTDYSGFIAAYRQVRGTDGAGRVGLFGAGGVGKAVAFGLLKLGVQALCIVDLDRAKAADLEARLGAAAPGLPVTLADSVEGLPDRIDGVINCTPVGMVGYGGTPLPRARMGGPGWAFDAVYTPLDTQFLTEAAAEGRTIISGYELFFHQGVDAWRLFADCPVDPTQLRRLLGESGAGPQA